MTCIKQTNRADMSMCLQKGMSPYFGTSLILVVGGLQGSTVGSRHRAKFVGLTKGYLPSHSCPPDLSFAFSGLSDLYT